MKLYKILLLLLIKSKQKSWQYISMSEKKIIKNIFIYYTGNPK